ncbi:hypothetical protein FRB94_009225 [Tulasnella sp. JGI-2019a]|nr:hypothetical protein FRB94_009225 [Tulasnella sp. JGI-2019a]KAG9016482.1 hypothetical protein FRB93_010731 [Tulasnella sp. JGI-2019a]
MPAELRRARTPARLHLDTNYAYTPNHHHIIRSSPRRHAIVSGRRLPSLRPTCRGPRLSPIQQHPGLSTERSDNEDEEGQAGPSSRPPVTLPRPLIAEPEPHAAESNHWLNPGDRFILLGGDDENFLPFVVEAVERAALVPFEVMATYPSASSSSISVSDLSASGSESDCDHDPRHDERVGSKRASVKRYCIPYVESTRVFVDPGREWYRIVRPFESLAQARDLGVKERSWRFLDARDEDTRAYPGELARKRAAEFVNVLVGNAETTATEGWKLEWILWPGEASRQRIPGGWNSEADIQLRGFTWRDGPDHSMTVSHRWEEKPWLPTDLLLPRFYDAFPPNVDGDYNPCL